MQTLRQDIAYALRQMRLSPVFTLTAMLTLALGIGATTAIFSLIDTVMLKSLPVADPSSLYRVGEGRDCCIEGSPQDNWGMFSYPFYQRMKENAPEFAELAAFEAGGYEVSVRRSERDRMAKPLRGEFVTGNYFSTFGVSAFAGRTLAPSDDEASSAPAAMLSYRAWQQEYGSDPGVVGSTFILSDHPFTIVGITPPGFFGETLRSDPPEVYLPVQQEPQFRGENSLLHRFPAWLRVIGRLKPGASPNALPGRMTNLLRAWLVTDSGMPSEWMSGVKAQLSKQTIRVIPAGGGVAAMKADYAVSLRILLAVCCLVLLIACANIANLLLARGASRRTQTSVRLALGASRSRLIRQSLTESLVLSVMGGAAGLAVAYVGVKAVVALAFHGAKYVPIGAAPSLPVLGFAFGLSLVTGMLFGTAPAWLATHADPAEALRGANRSTRDRSSFSQKALVVVQATLSVVLLAGAGLLTRSLDKLQHQDFGYALDHRVTISLTAPFSTYSQPRLDAMYRELQDRLTHLPGVEHAALAQYTPLEDNWGEIVIRQGHGMPNMNDDIGSSWDHVGPGYLETLDERVIRGRGLTEDDTASTQNVAVVNQTFVKRFFKPGEDPIGAHFGLDLPQYSSTYEIVGVVPDAKYIWGNLTGSEPPRPLFFVALAQRAHYDNPLMQSIDDSTHYIEGAVLQVHGGMEGLEPQVRQVLSDIDPNLTLLSLQTLEDQVDGNFDQQRAVARMTGLFGILALILAAVGLYGVTAYTVERRTSEIGVRMALGANRVNVVRLVLRGAFLQILVGLLIGIPISIGCSRLIASQLYQVKGWDPLVLGGAVLALAVCALIASIIPAQRAASINPVKALRTE
ncbi:ABC transporter permease [Paracidobacterium acidisoli]|uniref:ABC transporter substrate-binding protein n=1 Tax=Paracidobacterium acidisoli TaxID=2303751 RepID=A0A372IUG5_9BACT|nr:ABC transporter permease [Paracidobacterium acidisoli]MBT9330024.1 ABC transporter permease [Paracidobacterium acidisoli]